jgi:hypothetical protein
LVVVVVVLVVDTGPVAGGWVDVSPSPAGSPEGDPAEAELAVA